MLFNTGDASFDSLVGYYVGGFAVSAATADFDEDGSNDVAVAIWGSQQVAILLNLGNGAFTTPPDYYPTGFGPYSVCAEDFGNDTHIDLAVANFESETITILSNNGDGTFTVSQTLPSGGSAANICAACMDSDEFPDLVVANQGGEFSVGSIAVCVNNGDGSFADPEIYDFAINDGLTWVVAADFDDDFDNDLAVTIWDLNQVVIMENDGSGLLSHSDSIDVGTHPISAVAEDFNGDGMTDLATANFESDNVSVLLNSGGGLFLSADSYSVGDGANCICAADLDNDGDIDLATANQNSDVVSVLINQSGATSYVCGDANSSGSVDIDDAVYLINYIFSGGPEPAPYESGDADTSGQVDIDDVVFLVNYIFAGGHEPYCSGTGSDIDDNVYRTIKIGDQWWMMENLKVIHYRNGDPIAHVTDQYAWESLTSGAYCNYDNDEGHVATYGRLYNWYAVDDSRIFAPEGWHVPSDDEWKQLEMYLGMSQAEADADQWRGTYEGNKLKEAGTIHWGGDNFGATNESRFTALPRGYRYGSGHFHVLGDYGYFWSETLGVNSAWNRGLSSSRSDISRIGCGFRDGFSIRCVRD